jgi:choline kinase
LAEAGADIRTVSIHGEDWQEVDFPEDVEKEQALTAKWASGRPRDSVDPL